MSLRSTHEIKRKDSLRVSAGSLWQDPLAIELSNSGKNNVTSPRSRTRALAVVYIVVEHASVPQSEENLSLKCLQEACADTRAVLKTIPFERIALGTTDVLDNFYNAGKLLHVLTHSRIAICAQSYVAILVIAIFVFQKGQANSFFTHNLARVLFTFTDVAVVEMSDSFCQPSLFYHLGVRESFNMTNNIILYCNKQEDDLQALKVQCAKVS